MKIIMDARTYQLRGVCADDSEVIPHETHIELPMSKIHDLNVHTAIIANFDGEIPPLYPRYAHYYDPSTKQFRMGG